MDHLDCSNVELPIENAPENFEKLKFQNFLKKSPIRLITSNLVFNTVVLATKSHVIQCKSVKNRLMTSKVVAISALRIEILERNYLIVHENKSNNLVLFNASMQKVKTLTGVQSANYLDIGITCQYWDLCSSDTVKNLKLRYLSSVNVDNLVPDSNFTNFDEDLSENQEHYTNYTVWIKGNHQVSIVDTDSFEEVKIIPLFGSSLHYSTLLPVSVLAVDDTDFFEGSTFFLG